MATIAAMARALNSVQLRQEVPKIIAEDAQTLSDLNRSQLWDGLTAEGKPVRPVYASDRYADYKQRITPNAKRDRLTPNLYETGSFHESIQASVKQDEIVFSSENELSQHLENKYGQPIFGLDDASKAAYSKQLLEKIKGYITKQTGLHFS